MRRLPLLSLCFVFSNNHFIQSSVASTSLDSCCICNRIFIVFNSLQPSTFTQVSPTASLQDLWNGISINFILIATHRSTDQHNTSLYKPSRPRLKHKNRVNNQKKEKKHRKKNHTISAHLQYSCIIFIIDVQWLQSATKNQSYILLSTPRIIASSSRFSVDITHLTRVFNIILCISNTIIFVSSSMLDLQQNQHEERVKELGTKENSLEISSKPEPVIFARLLIAPIR